MRKDFGTIVLKFRRNKVFLLLMVLSLGGTTRADLTTGLSPRENNSDPVPLIEAAKNQDWDKLRTLLEQGEKATVTSADGATALHWASYWDNIETAELLINSGANPNAVNDLGATALWNASLNGSEEMVGMLLGNGADPAISLVSGESPVMTAARTGNAKVVELLLMAGADPNARGARGQTALMWAAAQHHSAAVSALLEHGADVHARSETWSQVMAIPPHSDPANQQNVPHGNNTALMFAAREGDVASAKLLIAAGARVNDFNARGTSAIVLAAHSGYRDVVEFLLDVSADPDAAEAGFSALHLAIMRRDHAMARTLLEHGADPNAQVTNWSASRRASSDWHFHPALVGAAPFWLAARFIQPATMRLLVNHGADPLFVHHADYIGAEGTFGTVQRMEKTTALMAAVGMGGPRRMRAYIDPSPSEVEALTFEAVKLAVELGIDTKAEDQEGWTAADAARYESVVEYLVTNRSRR
ncbi:MAG: ankyrin repeat domain-containing protein [Gemmatimonadota bacterium]|nr:ankyrin repeat domain-containing protein [Gemmatimonadota bacterium]